MGKMKLTSCLKWLILTTVICLGIFVRVIDLSTHYSHADDNGIAYTILEAKKSKSIDEIRTILAEKSTYPRLKILKKLDEVGLLDDIVAIDNRLHISQFFIIPLRFTYAPLQFILTPLLISRTQSYQEILFRGRFPSFIFSILTLLLLIPLYKLFKKEKYFPYLIFSLVLITFSWENIIYAKHMSPYSIGVFGAVLVLYLFLYEIERVDFSLQRLLLHSLFLGIISYAQYQILFFIPAYYLSLFCYHFSKTSERIKLIKNFAVSGILYSLLIFPMYFFFLRHLTSRQDASYGMYAAKEFVFGVPSDASVIEKLIKIVLFFCKNSMLALQSNLAFIPEIHPLATPALCTLTGLFLIGVLSFLTTNCSKKKILGLFFLIIAVIWAMLVIKQKLSLAPTRHNLILLPYQAIIISEGLGYLFTKFESLNVQYSLSSLATLFLSFTIIFFFFTKFQEVTTERHDNYNEKEIFNLLEKYKTSTVISYNGSANFALMLFNKKPFLSHFESTHWQYYIKPPNYDRIAFNSHHFPLNKKTFDELKQSINSNSKSLNTFKHNFSQYKTIFSKEINSNAQIDFSNRVKTNPNSYYFYILERSNGH